MGGPIGSVEFPDYLQEQHSYLLAGCPTRTTSATLAAFFLAHNDNDFLDYMDESITTGNPYSAETAYDPTSDIGAIGVRNDRFYTLADEFDPAAVWGQIAAEAIGKASLITDQLEDEEDDDIEEEVADFRNRTLAELGFSYNRLAATLRDVNAPHAFPMAMAVLEAEHEGKVMAHRSAIVQQQRAQKNIPERKTQLIIGAITAQLDIYRTQMDALRAGAVLESDYRLKKIAANVDWKSQTQELADRSRKWKLELIQDGMNLLSGMSGTPGAVVPDRRSYNRSQTTQGILSLAQLGMLASSNRSGMGVSLLTGLLSLA